jgi:hypothetical protein
MAKQRGKGGEFFNCPCCGAEVPVGATFCRECGASDDSGWGEGDDSQDEDSPTGYGPDDDFDYDEYVSREFPDQSPDGSRPRVKQWAMAVLVAIVAAAFLASMMFWG